MIHNRLFKKSHALLVACLFLIVLLPGVVSSFLCKIFIGQFFEERQVLAHFSYGV